MKAKFHELRISASLALFALGLTMFTATAYAGDAMTIIFKSGQVVKVDDGYRQVLDSMRRLKSENDGPVIVELNVNGGTYMLNIAEVVIACKDTCTGITIMHQLASKPSAAAQESASKSK